MSAVSTAYNRRDALKLGVLGSAGLALGLPAASPAPLPVKARSVIQVWMWGGPAHLDTFDPKPEAGPEYCGPYTQPIATAADHMLIGEKLPLLARQADKFSVIRSMTHGINAHETASYLVQTGHEPGRLVYPCIGAVVSRLRGVRAGYTGAVPPYVVLTESQGRFSESGFLGPEFRPFVTGGDPATEPFVVEGIIAKGMTDARQHRRRDLLHRIDRLAATSQGDPFADLAAAEDKAYEMMFGPAREVFKLEAESDAMRDRYGRTRFGQACLAARRLVEHGVPWITLNYKGWDTHKTHFNIMDRTLPEMDQALSALLEDLAQRGLLDTTIVWWSGEFGRGPKIQWDPPWNGGRSHHGACFSALLAGGGFRGGAVIGASDRTGTEVASRPVVPQNLLGSLYTQMGIDPAGPLPNDRGLDLAIMPGADQGDGMLREIMT